MPRKPTGRPPGRPKTRTETLPKPSPVRVYEADGEGLQAVERAASEETPTGIAEVSMQRVGEPERREGFIVLDDKPSPVPRGVAVIASRLSGETLETAASASGAPSRQSAQHAQNQALKAAPIAEAFVNAGMTPEWFVELIRQGSLARRYELDRQGNRVDLGPDWIARSRVADMALKAARHMPEPGQGGTGNGGGAMVIRIDAFERE